MEIRINFLQYKYEARRLRRQKYLRMGIAAGIAVLIAGSFILSTVLIRQDISSLKKENEEYRLKIKAKQHYDHLYMHEDFKKDLRKQRSLVRDLKQESLCSSAMLEELAGSGIRGVTITYTEADKACITIKGYANNYGTLAELLDWMRASQYFTLVSEMSTSKEDSTGELGFSMAVKWEGR